MKTISKRKAKIYAELREIGATPRQADIFLRKHHKNLERAIRKSIGTQIKLSTRMAWKSSSEQILVMPSDYMLILEKNIPQQKNVWNLKNNMAKTKKKKK